MQATIKYNINRVTVLLFALTIFIGCTKKENLSPEIASLNVVNAIIDGGSVMVNYFGKPVNWKNYNSGTAEVGFGTSRNYNLSPGADVHIVRSGDTTKTLYRGVVANSDREIFSLFLTGNVSAPESIIVKDNLPAFYSDMSIGVRVINLSPNSAPVNITLSSTPEVNEFSSIGYKQITDIKKLPYPTTITTGSNVFQVRDSAGALLASYTLPPTGALSIASARYRVITLVVRGLQGTTSGTNAYSLFAIQNF